MPARSAQLYTVRSFLQTPAEIAESLKKIRAIGCYRFVEVSSLEHIPAPEIKSMLALSGLLFLIPSVKMHRRARVLGR